MDERKLEKRINITLYQKIGESAIEMLDLLQMAYGEDFLSNQLFYQNVCQIRTTVDEII